MTELQSLGDAMTPADWRASVQHQHRRAEKAEAKLDIYPELVAALEEVIPRCDAHEDRFATSTWSDYDGWGYHCEECGWADDIELTEEIAAATVLAKAKDLDDNP